MNKRMVLIGLSLLTLILFLFMLFVDSHSSADNDGGSSINAQDAGPDAPYPLSFPKMCGGIILMEQSGGELSLSQDQARRLIPVLHELGKAWKKMRFLEESLRDILSDEQQDFILENKHKYEHLRFLRENLPAVFEGDNIRAAKWALQKRAEEKNSENRELKKPSRKHLITFFDMTTGIYMMDGIPTLAVTREQAQKLLPLYNDLHFLEIVSDCTSKMEGILSPFQKTFIQTDIAEVTKTKNNAHDGRYEEGPYKDALIWHVIQLMEKKAGNP